MQNLKPLSKEDNTIIFVGRHIDDMIIKCKKAGFSYLKIDNEQKNEHYHHFYYKKLKINITIFDADIEAGIIQETHTF